MFKNHTIFHKISNEILLAAGIVGLSFRTL
jgi:hypothetical protein